VDGYDETLCPLDFQTQGMIVDDEINATIVRPLPSGVKLHAIIDACHSGTVLDLPYLCRMDRWVLLLILLLLKISNGFHNAILWVMNCEKNSTTVASAIVCYLLIGFKSIFPYCPFNVSSFLYFLCLSVWERGCRDGRYVWEDHRPRTGMWKGSNGGEVISFSGCDDDQTSADTSVKSQASVWPFM